MAAKNREDALIESLEKLTGIFDGAVEKLDALADSLDMSGEEFDGLNDGMTDKEIAEQIGAPLVSALDGLNAILGGVNEEFMNMANCDSDLITELKLYIKEAKTRSVDNVSDLASEFIKEKRNHAGFARSLDEFREKKGMSPSQLYKAAWIDKRLYSKIMSTSDYKPAKNTAISFGLALKLNPGEFASFFRNAGYALSNSSIFDLVIRFCVERGIYDLHEVNALLLQTGQKTLAREAA